MPDSEFAGFDLSHKEIGGAPILRYIFDRIGLDDLLKKHVPERDLGRTSKVSHARALSVMVSNSLMSRRPLYAVPAWLEGHVLTPFGLEEGEASLFNDDRIGRALDRLYEADTASLMTAVVIRTVREFNINLDQVHNDTTTVTFSGAYEKQKAKDEAERPPLITFGHNKDHRPDLKQLVWSLTVSSDGAVPVHYKTYDGNMSDDQVHQETWSAIREIAGRPDFVYVADSKLCTRENMAFIANEGGRFVTVLPRTRKEHDEFYREVRERSVKWQEIRRDENPRGKFKRDLVYEAHDPKRCTAEGHRILWYRSSSKWESDEQARKRCIYRARRRLEKLQNRTGSHRLRTKERAEAEVEKILGEERASRWLKVSVEDYSVSDLRQQGPGRPGKETTYKKVDVPVFLLDIVDNGEAITADALTDGIFGMVTNLSETTREILDIYKYQPFLEKRHEQLKSVMSVAPVFLKKPERVSALLFVYFLAVVVMSLIERELRRAMKEKEIESLPLYPEQRQCKAPTSAVILQAVEGLRTSQLLDGEGNVVRTFFDQLKPEVKQMLQLLNVDLRQYGLTRRS